jgi:hypothetical protein
MSTATDSRSPMKKWNTTIRLIDLLIISMIWNSTLGQEQGDGTTGSVT